MADQEGESSFQDPPARRDCPGSPQRDSAASPGENAGHDPGPIPAAPRDPGASRTAVSLWVAVCAREPETQRREEARLRALTGAEFRDPSSGPPGVLIYAAHSPHDFIALLGANFEPYPRSVVLDLAALIDPRVAALLGALAYVRHDCPSDQLQYCLEEVAEDYPYAQQPGGGVFYRTRERALLTVEEKKILSLAAQGYTRARIEQEMKIPAGTLKQRITALRKTLAAPLPGPLSLTATRMGFGPPEAPG